MRNAIVIDIEYCEGCHSCEVACKNEKHLEQDQYGIKMLEVKPFIAPDGKWVWDYYPVLTSVCDLCEERVAAGGIPSCVKHCLGECMYYGTEEEMLKKMDEIGGHVHMMMP